MRFAVVDLSSVSTLDAASATASALRDIPRDDSPAEGYLLLVDDPGFTVDADGLAAETV